MTNLSKVTPVDFLTWKNERRKITMLSIYDYAVSVLADRAGLDSILVGDSLAMTALGYESTVSVTLEEMLHHTKAVARGAKRAMVIADMPFMSYQVSPSEAVRNAGRFIQEGGADAVKLEGGRPVVAAVRAIHDAGIPVMGHIGLTPQSASMLGGLKVQGKDAEAASKLLDEARSLERAGAFAIILECVPREVAQIVTEALSVPTISYGAGVHCDGQGIVTADMFGLFEKFTPRFSKVYVDLASQITEAIGQYREDVTNGSFPDDQHSYGISPEELQKLRQLLDTPAYLKLDHDAG